MGIYKRRMIGQNLSGREKNILSTFLNEISNIPILSKEEEVELARRIKSGDNEALNKLVEANMRFLVSYVKKYEETGVGLLDLINQGSIGLRLAAKKFDPENNENRFLTYAIFWIRVALNEYLRHEGIFTIPSHVYKKLKKLARSVDYLKTKLHREPSEEEIAAEMELEIKDVFELMELEKIIIIPIYEDPVYEDTNGGNGYSGIQIKDNSESVEDNVIMSILSERLHEVIDELTEYKREIILADMNGENIQKKAEELKRTKMCIYNNIKKIKKKVIKEMRARCLEASLN